MLEQEEEKLLDEATAVVKEQAFYMKRSIDNENLRDALKHGSNMICELRTSLLSPKNYYELYMQVFQELQHLGNFVNDKTRYQRKMSDLYESVQHAGNIIPRLYLVITVGAVFLKSREAPARDILTDMTELCKGVQHPMRGLFLRYYLTQMCKDKLPDLGSEYAQNGGGSIEDAFEFLMANFTESSRLWVRLQSQGSSRDKQRREKERHDLRVLVGANLVRMAQLDGMSATFFANVALPNLLEQILVCKDTMAQQYLLDCVIQVFSDECHLTTLDKLLGACLRVQPGVDLKSVLVNLMNRLYNFVHSNPHCIPKDVDVFQLFQNYLDELFARPSKSAEADDAVKACGSGISELGGLLELQVAFLSFITGIFPDRVDYVDTILGSSVKLLRNFLSPQEHITGPGAERVVEILSRPLRTLSLTILELDCYTELMNFLDLSTRKQVAISMVDAVVDSETPLDDLHAVERFFSFISPLIKDEPGVPTSEEDETNEFIHEQQQVGRLIHAIQHPDPSIQFEMLGTARNHLCKGGVGRIMHTIPALITVTLKLIPCIVADNVAGPSVKKIFQFLHKCCTDIIGSDAEVGIRMFLQCAIVVNNVEIEYQGNHEPICYEFLTQALVGYEDELSESRSQFQALTMIVGTVCSYITCLELSNYDNLTAKITQHGAKLLKKPDQCRAVLLCSHLFWNNPDYKDSRRVLECLKKCLKIADLAVQSSPVHVQLFSEILDKYIYYFEQRNTEVTHQFIQNLISLCVEHMRYADTDVSEDARLHFSSIVQYIEYQNDTSSSSIFQGLDIEDASKLC